MASETKGTTTQTGGTSSGESAGGTKVPDVPVVTG